MATEQEQLSLQYVDRSPIQTQVQNTKFVPVLSKAG